MNAFVQLTTMEIEIMAKTVDLGVVADRLKAVQHGLSGEAFKGSAEIVDNHIVLRAEVARAGRTQAHSEMVAMVEVFFDDRDVLADALHRLKQWAAEVAAAA